jgi:hypothetical protein
VLSNIRVALILCMLFAMCFCGCGATGTRVKVQNQCMSYYVRRVALAPVDYRPAMPNLKLHLSDTPENVFMNTFAGKLKKRYVFTNTTLLQVDEQYHLTDSELLNMALIAEDDALLRIELELQPKDYYDSGDGLICDLVDVLVKATLFDAHNGSVFFTANYISPENDPAKAAPSAEESINAAAGALVDAIIDIRLRREAGADR